LLSRSITTSLFNKLLLLALNYLHQVLNYTNKHLLEKAKENKDSTQNKEQKQNNNNDILMIFNFSICV